jgi:hypothetical protein
MPGRELLASPELVDPRVSYLITSSARASLPVGARTPAFEHIGTIRRMLDRIAGIRGAEMRQLAEILTKTHMEPRL